MIKKVDKFELTMAAEVLLRRAREKKRRVEKKKEDKKEAIANMKGVGRAAAETKLAYHMAKWVDKVNGKLTQKEFSLKYADSRRRKHMFILHDVPWGKPSYQRQMIRQLLLRHRSTYALHVRDCLLLILLQ